MNLNNEIIYTGGPFEMGQQQGKRYSVQIHAGWETLRKYDGIKAAKPPGIPMPLFLFAAGLKAKKSMKTSFRRISEFAERFDGIADGAQIASWKLALMHYIEIIGADAARRLMGCSSIAAVPPKSTEPILAKNFDFINEFGSAGILRKTLCRSEFCSIEFTLNAIAGSHTGMNEAGLAVTYNYGYSNENPMNGVLLTAKIQHILQNCATVREAVPLLRKKPNPSAGIITLVDSKGGYLAVEIAPDGTALVEPNSGLLVNANLYEHPQMWRRMISKSAVYGEKAPKHLKGTPIQATNIIRTERLKYLVDKCHKLDVDAIKKMLADHGEENEPSGDTICRHHKSYRTHLSAIFLPVSGRIIYTWGNPCEAHWQEDSIGKRWREGIE